jgi:hypothetical protein
VTPPAAACYDLGMLLKEFENLVANALALSEPEREILYYRLGQCLPDYHQIDLTRTDLIYPDDGGPPIEPEVLQEIIRRSDDFEASGYRGYTMEEVKAEAMQLIERRQQERSAST